MTLNPKQWIGFAVQGSVVDLKPKPISLNPKQLIGFAIKGHLLYALWSICKLNQS